MGGYRREATSQAPNTSVQDTADSVALQFQAELAAMSYDQQTAAVMPDMPPVLTSPKADLMSFVPFGGQAVQKKADVAAPELAAGGDQIQFEVSDEVQHQAALEGSTDAPTSAQPQIQHKKDEDEGGGGFFSKAKSFFKKTLPTIVKTAVSTGKSLIGAALSTIDPREPIYQWILSDEDRIPKLLEQTADIPNQDIIYEQLAHRGAYGKLKPEELLLWGYTEVAREEDGGTGFGAYLYMPTPEVAEGSSPTALKIIENHGRAVVPVVAFRGTANLGGVKDDLNVEGVGAYQYAAAEAAIRGILGASGGGADVTGHSLGGALAQIVACRIPDQVTRIVTFQSPAVSQKDADALAEYNAGQSEEDQIDSTHYRASGDLVHLAGEQLTEGDVYTMDSVGVGNLMDHTSFPLAKLNAARGNPVKGVRGKGGKPGQDRLVNVERTTSKEEADEFGLLSERVRGAAGTAFEALANENLDSYAKLWADLKLMITDANYSLSMILSIIDIQGKFKQEHKDRMKANVVSLYDKLQGTGKGMDKQ